MWFKRIQFAPDAGGAGRAQAPPVAHRVAPIDERFAAAIEQHLQRPADVQRRARDIAIEVRRLEEAYRLYAQPQHR
jgi:hypothetical protein